MCLSLGAFYLCTLYTVYPCICVYSDVIYIYIYTYRALIVHPVYFILALFLSLSLSVSLTPSPSLCLSLSVSVVLSVSLLGGKNSKSKRVPDSELGFGQRAGILQRCGFWIVSEAGLTGRSYTEVTNIIGSETLLAAMASVGFSLKGSYDSCGPWEVCLHLNIRTSPCLLPGRARL